MAMGVSSRMLSLYNLAVRGLQMQSDCSGDPSLGNKAAAAVHRIMDTLPTHFAEGTSCMRGEDGDEEAVEEDGDDEDDKEEEKDESAVKGQHRAAWAPSFFIRMDKEVFNFVGQEIVIREALDSYAGMIWPAAQVLCHYLETHREQLSLVDKAVLELGAGTGLVSVVAALLGAWVTATDLEEFLGNLRVNLSSNTRGRCRHTPQVAALPWGYDLERTYPTSVYHYDYVLAADVVYHHDFLDELLATMKHFCKPGTTLIWANKLRMESDMNFTENFKKAFHTSLLVDDGEMKIFMATYREEEREGDAGMKRQDLPREEVEGKREEDEHEKSAELEEEKHNDAELRKINVEKKGGKVSDDDVAEEPHTSEKERGDDTEDEITDEEEEMEAITVLEEDDVKEDENDPSCSIAAADEDVTGQAHITQPAVQRDTTPLWIPSFSSSLCKDIYRYAGHDIVIHESIDSFGAVMWPAALALCSFLDDNRQKVNLQGKEVLELGAGTGLVTIVASLLGASVTATDLPEVLSNLRANVMRNTRGRCRHTPQVAALPWGHDLERTYPTSAHRYDYVLAADVVYHHDFLDKLLVTMKHFCKPGTTLIWANKVRFESDLTFTENFKKAFHTSLLVEDGEMKIFMATCRD